MARVRFVPAPPRTRFAPGTNPGFDDRAVTERLLADVSWSERVKLRLAKVSSSMARSARSEKTGASFTGSTVSRKDRLARRFDGAPSSTVTVTSVVPTAFGLVANCSVPVLRG